MTKTSTSLGNHISLHSSADGMFGLLMSLPDEAMSACFELLTSIPGPEVETLLAGHPQAAKPRLAREITARFHAPRGCGILWRRSCPGCFGWDVVAFFASNLSRRRWPPAALVGIF